ncbi:MAG: hypothetical protein IJI84_03710 [Clostridia bacterium]|nr:hypothetical protein [Clostridia bacterium]
MQKANKSKKLIKLMAGVLSVLTILSPTSLAAKSFESEDKLRISEKFKNGGIFMARLLRETDIKPALKLATSSTKKLVIAGVNGDEDFPKLLAEYTWTGTRDYNMALIIVAFYAYCTKSEVPDLKKFGFSALRGGSSSNKMFEALREGNGKKVKYNMGSYFQAALDAVLKKALPDDEGKRAKIIKSFINQAGKITPWKINKKDVANTLDELIGKIRKSKIYKSKYESNKSELPSEFKVFKIAVIGSDDPKLSKTTVKKLCSCGVGKPLRSYVVADVACKYDNLKNKEIELYKGYPERLPKDSILTSRDGGWVVLSFYYVESSNEAKKIIPECQYAICPLRAKSEEIEGDLNKCKLKKRLTELKKFIRQYNKTCDIRFLYYIDNIKQADDVGRYKMTISEFSRDLYNDDPKLLLQQEVQSHSLSIENEQCYRECFNSLLNSMGRKVEEFEQLPNKKVLKINYLEVLEKIRFADELN